MCKFEDTPKGQPDGCITINSPLFADVGGGSWGTGADHVPVWVQFRLTQYRYPLVMTNSLLLKMAIEIVSFPIDSMVILHTYVYVCQRVTVAAPNS